MNTIDTDDIYNQFLGYNPQAAEKVLREIPVHPREAKIVFLFEGLPPPFVTGDSNKFREELKSYLTKCRKLKIIPFSQSHFSHNSAPLSDGFSLDFRTDDAANAAYGEFYDPTLHLQRFSQEEMKGFSKEIFELVRSGGRKHSISVDLQSCTAVKEFRETYLTDLLREGYQAYRGTLKLAGDNFLEILNIRDFRKIHLHLANREFEYNGNGKHSGNGDGNGHKTVKAKKELPAPGAKDFTEQLTSWFDKLKRE